MQRLSRNFLMVNCEGSEIPEDSDMYLDGEYSPKIFFTDVEKNHVHPELYNRMGKKDYKYYYVDGEQLADGMREAAVVLRKGKAQL